MRWFTCTPIDFEGGAVFFARDSGLLSRGFREMGVESMAVMPGPGRADDEAELIRTDFQNLASAEWWKKHRLDGVVLYAWGSPRFRHIARAIRRSGAKLVLNQDSSGVVSPLCGLGAWLNEQRVVTGGDRVTTWMRMARGLSVGLLVTDPLRAAHLRQGGWISCVHPAAAEHYRKLCRIYGGEDLAQRVVLVPHPVSPAMRFDDNSPPKRRQVAAVGRWDDDVQKRPGLLMEALGLLLSRDQDVRVEIVGNVSRKLEIWHSELPAESAGRVRLRGKLPHDELRAILSASQVNYCPSAYESFNIAAAEALCCGCSVVAADIPTMASFRWFVSKDSGTLTRSDNAESHASALAGELDLWENGRRDAVSISRAWSGVFHADRVAAEILRINSAEEI